MAVERWQLFLDCEDHHGGRARPQGAHWRHAAEGWGSADRRAGPRPGGVHLCAKPSWSEAVGPQEAVRPGVHLRYEADDVCQGRLVDTRAGPFGRLEMEACTTTPSLKEDGPGSIKCSQTRRRSSVEGSETRLTIAQSV